MKKWPQSQSSVDSVLARTCIPNHGVATTSVKKSTYNASTSAELSQAMITKVDIHKHKTTAPEWREQQRSKVRRQQRERWHHVSVAAADNQYARTRRIYYQFDHQTDSDDVKMSYEMS